MTTTTEIVDGEENPPLEKYRGGIIWFYDALCPVCSDAVCKAIDSDSQMQLFYSPLQSAFAKLVLAEYGIDHSSVDQMYVLSDYGTSDEALRRAAPARNYVFLHLAGEFRTLGEIESAKPRAVQDEEYRAASDSRFEVYGRLRRMFVPVDGRRQRFIV